MTNKKHPAEEKDETLKAEAEGEGEGKGDIEEDPADEGDAEEEAAVKAEPEESSDLRYARLYAEFQNYKKRTASEGYERYIEGKKDLAGGLIEVLDNFDRAIHSEASAGIDKGFIEGMDMVRKQLLDVLSKSGIEEIEALGEDFDPKFHQGVGTEAGSEYESGRVSLVLQKGYAIGDKVIRAAMVKIAE